MKVTTDDGRVIEFDLDPGEIAHEIIIVARVTHEDNPYSDTVLIESADLFGSTVGIVMTTGLLHQALAFQTASFEED